MLSADLRGNRETNLSPGISTVRPSTSSLYIYTVWIQKLCSRNPHRFSNCFQSLGSSNLGCFSLQAERQRMSHSLSIPQIFSKSPSDQSQSVFKTGQEWGMYLVNHLFKKRKGKEKPTPPVFVSPLIFFPCTSSGDLACHLSRQFLICRENKLAVLFRQWMSGKGLGNTVRLPTSTRFWCINSSCAEI